MMLGEQELGLDLLAGAALDEVIPQQPFLEQLLLEPHRHRHAERGEALGRERQIGLEQTLELQERLVVEGDVIDLVEPDAALGQAVLDRFLGKARIVLLAREPLFLGGGEKLAVGDQRGRAVVVERRQAEDPHPPPLRSEHGVDERRHGAALGQHDQSAEQGHHQHDRQQPILLAHPHELPQLGQKRHSLLAPPYS
jgi:hypothetical protein